MIEPGTAFWRRGDVVALRYITRGGEPGMRRWDAVPATLWARRAWAYLQQ